MNRRIFLLHLHHHKCFLRREGKKHSLYSDPHNHKFSTVPRHRELDDFLARKICKDLGIPPMKNK